MRILIPFIGGVLLFHEYPTPSTYFIPGIISLITLIIFIIAHQKESYIRTFSFSLFLISAAFTLGAVNLSLRYNYTVPEFQETGYWKGTINAIPSETDSTVQCDIRLLASESKTCSAPVRRLARIRVQKNYRQTFSPGDNITFYATLRTPLAQGNPGEFNYARWLQRKQIHYTGRVDSLCWQTSPPETYSFQSSLAAYRIKAKKIINTLVNEPRNAHLISALLLGDKSDLPAQSKEIFRMNGISHLLAVSGFHAGMIFSIILLLFIFIPSKYIEKKYIRLIAIIVLWLYAFLVGATPSVIRASVMISVFVAGGMLRRKNYAFNTLSFAALVLLIADPFALWDIGFQLSFAAVAGILSAQYIADEYFRSDNPVIKKMTSFLLICMAAQIATLPLTLFYFGTFSPYFLLGNIIAIPFVYLLLILFVLLAVIFLPTGFILTPLQQILNGIMHIFHELLTMVSSLPYASLQTPLYATERIILLYAGICLFLLFVHYKRSLILICSLGCILLLALPFDRWNTRKLPHMVILNNKPGHTIYLNNGTQYQVWSKTHRKDEIENAGRYYRTKKINHTTFESAISINNLRILYLDTDSLRYKKSTDTFSVDLLVLKRGCKGDLTKINQLFSPQKILFDGSLTTYWHTKWKNEADSLSIPYYDMKENGAFSYFFH